MRLHSRWFLPLAALGTLVLVSPKSLPAPGGGPIGESFCGPNYPNSTGQPGVLSAYGSERIITNDVTLTASQLPPGQFGYFLVSRTEGFFQPCPCPYICLGGVIGRYNGDVGQGPTFSLQIDLNNLPTTNPGSQQTLPGETLHFQAWYRDTWYHGYNFTDGLKITFH